jgi:hypothetical protein
MATGLSDAFRRSVRERMEQQMDDNSNALPGQITAAGGWCAPSDTVYNLIDLGNIDPQMYRILTGFEVYSEAWE